MTVVPVLDLYQINKIMGFVPISIDKYVALHLKNNPSTNEKELRTQLNKALTSYKKGIKCSCGNTIWVVGSAIVGNRCYTCITGDSFPENDLEIDIAINKNNNIIERRHIDNIDKTKISSFFDDDGFEINSDLINKPQICITCVNYDNSDEEILCNMTRYDQRNNDEFKCCAYEKKEN